MKNRKASYSLARHKNKNGEDYVSFVKDRTITKKPISTKDQNFGCRQQTITRKKPNKDGEIVSYTRYYKNGVIVGPDMCPPTETYGEYKKMEKRRNPTTDEVKWVQITKGKNEGAWRCMKNGKFVKADLCPANKPEVAPIKKKGRPIKIQQ